MIIPNYSPSRKEYNQHEYWMGVESGKTSPDEYQSAMMKLIKQAESEGIFYEKDMRRWMFEHTPFIPESAWFMQFETNQTEGGVMGMEVYYARSASRAIERRERNLAAAKTIQPGDVLGTLMVNNKKVTRATVEKIEGQSVTCRATIGRYGCTFTTEAANIEGMKARAIQKGWRKS